MQTVLDNAQVGSSTVEKALQVSSTRTQRILARLRKHNVKVASSGTEELMLFPTYSRRTRYGEIEVDVKGLLSSPGLPGWRNKMIMMSARKIMGIQREQPAQEARARSLDSDDSADDTLKPPVRRRSDDATLSLRLTPFMLQPVSNRTLRVTLYSSKGTISSQEVVTTSSGHFSSRIGTWTMPSAISVEVDKDLSLSEPVVVEETKGVSVISDIDDTIKHSAIYLGAKEVFRNTFLRNLSELRVKGVSEWYSALKDLNVSIHYVSNAPWQLYPVLKEFLFIAGLPAGSIHLKHYSGVLQGIFEPTAGRKRLSIIKVVEDFPERKFVLVGDSGEMDLEVYTDIALLHPHQVIGIYIRDVTTEQERRFFDGHEQQLPPSTNSSYPNSANSSTISLNTPPPLPPRPRHKSHSTEDLIALSSEDESIDGHSNMRKSYTDTLSYSPAPPIIPSKPENLQSYSLETKLTSRRSLPLLTARNFTEVNKRTEMWRLRMEKAKSSLEGLKIPITTWRTGDEVEADCIELIREYL